MIPKKSIFHFLPAAAVLLFCLLSEAQGAYSVLEYGAAGDGKANDAAAIQKAIDACHDAGGGRVLLPAGRTYLTGTIRLKANVDLHVEPGATLRGGDGTAVSMGPSGR